MMTPSMICILEILHVTILLESNPVYNMYQWVRVDVRV